MLENSSGEIQYGGCSAAGKWELEATSANCLLLARLGNGRSLLICRVALPIPAHFRFQVTDRDMVPGHRIPLRA